MVDAAVVVTTHNALPGSSPASRASRAPRPLSSTTTRPTAPWRSCASASPRCGVLEQANRGLAAGWKRGLEEIPPSRWVLILNADAWLDGDALTRLVAVGDAHRDVAVVAPKLLNPDGTLQRSVRGFPTRWRLATEYFYLRKLGPRTELLNGFYARRLRPRLRARGRVRDGRVHARARHRDRRGRPARPRLLPLQRGGRLVLPLRAGGLEDALHAGGAVHARRRRLARGPALPRQPARAPPLLPQASRARRGGAGAGAARRALGCAAASSAARRGRCTATPPAGSDRATSAR